MAALIFTLAARRVGDAYAARERSEVLFFHKSFGVTVFGLVVLRIVRLIVGAPTTPNRSGG